MFIFLDFLYPAFSPTIIRKNYSGRQYV